MGNKVCAFTGHRNVADPLIGERLERVIRELYGDGTELFICGGAVGFDTAAGEAVIRLKSELPIKLLVAVPFPGQDETFTEEERERYRRLIAEADGVKIISPRRTRDAYLKRNRFMVDKADVCVAYLKRENTGTAYTVRYARSKGKEVIMI